MRPTNLHTRIFLDSGGVDDTKIALDAIGFLDGQTTNPTYFVKSNKIQEQLKAGKKFTNEELLASYRETIESINKLIPKGSISIEIYADKLTTAYGMIKQATEMNEWILNAHIKFPIIPEGMRAAHMALEKGIRVNITLCFTQEQAAAVYAMSRGVKKGDIFVSLFMGRHFDAGKRGIDLIQNIIEMYKPGDGHVEALAASLRSLDQFLAAIQSGTDIITAGLKYINLWAENGMNLPGDDFFYNPEGEEAIEYQEFDLSKPWDSFNIQHEMTSNGLDQFARDWSALIK
ncbi:MAG: transaldolase [Candidatus Doudnabacteria bacterium CG10_big_fil_rev_8_21_14_0_10_41_10]|uniref:Transaldolase n=1 Tax=Candidatus Doudnabacteria bacterium CG10_big_fil_rev_8_21_14_0_10_41_10 TaxID=1974551 RepID=A0A2H0VCW1_9BACT|nr:MAG: transaldolase [Candidatus Doudnabacteria bacterium CG10_big_fil_rev_8_21_14_0_10_41_10]